MKKMHLWCHSMHIYIWNMWNQRFQYGNSVKLLRSKCVTSQDPNMEIKWNFQVKICDNSQDPFRSFCEVLTVIIRNITGSNMKILWNSEGQNLWNHRIQYGNFVKFWRSKFVTSHCTLTTLGDEHADTAEKIEQNVNDYKNIKKI